MTRNTVKKDENRQSIAGVLRAIRRHPSIRAAAVTGSMAWEGGADEYSDLDILVIAADPVAIRDVRAWFPPQPGILISAFHLTNYCTVLLDSFEKVDLAIFSIEDEPSRWVVHDFRVIKGDRQFEVDLLESVASTREKKAAHRNPDVSIDNVILLMATAVERVHRGERLSAHGFVAMAGQMLASLEKRSGGTGADADLLDPFRRLERTHSELAGVLHESLFSPPERGIRSLVKYISTRHGEGLERRQTQALEWLLKRSAQAQG